MTRVRQEIERVSGPAGPRAPLTYSHGRCVVIIISGSRIIARRHDSHGRPSLVDREAVQSGLSGVRQLPQSGLCYACVIISQFWLGIMTVRLRGQETGLIKMSETGLVSCADRLHIAMWSGAAWSS